jgi:hypothetical protein
MNASCLEYDTLLTVAPIEQQFVRSGRRWLNKKENSQPYPSSPPFSWIYQNIHSKANFIAILTNMIDCL